MKTKFLYLFLGFYFISHAQKLEFVNTGDLIISNKTVFTSKGKLYNQRGYFINNGILKFQSDFINEAVFTFEEEGQAILWVENEDESSISILGSKTLETKEFIQDANSNLYLINKMYIQNYLELISGKIINRESKYNLDLGYRANYLQHTDESYIDNYLNKSFYDSFIYPIGDQYFAPIKLTKESFSIEEIGLEYIVNPVDFETKPTIKDSSFEFNKINFYWKFYKQKPIKAKVELRIPLGILSEKFKENIELLSLIVWHPIQKAWEPIPTKVSDDLNYLKSEVAIFLPEKLSIGLRDNKESIVVYNAVNPQDINGNEYLRSGNTESYTKSHLRVFNIHGEKVFESLNSNAQFEKFKGIANHGSYTHKYLPEGVYFYKWKFYLESTQEWDIKLGYLYLKP